MVPEKERRIFENQSGWEAVLRLAVPTVLGQIILVLYNMADTFFVGRTGNDAMLTAVTVCMPAFLFLSAISNLFGIGGASVISRALGAGNGGRARKASAFAFWGCLLTTLLYSFLCYAFLDPFLDLLGGVQGEVHRNAREYLLVTVVFGGLVTSLGTLLSHLIRSEGRANLASLGIVLGGVLNIGLDPLFMFRLLPPGREAFGAALATALSNTASLCWFAAVLYIKRKKTVLTLRPSAAMLKNRIPADVFAAGIPACMMTLCENVSYAVLDKLMSLSGVAAQAGIGVAKKVNMLAHSIVRGIAQGALPLLAYNYAAGQFRRMRECFRIAQRIAVGAAALCMAVNLLMAPQLISLFIRSGSASLDHGIVFLRILCVGGPFSAAAYTVISFFQAVGEGRRSFLLAVLRKGILDIPLMFVLHGLLPLYGIVAATPVTDLFCSGIAVLFFQVYIRRIVTDPAGREASPLTKRARRIKAPLHLFGAKEAV